MHVVGTIGQWCSSVLVVHTTRECIMKWSNDSSSKVCLQLALNGNKRAINELTGLWVARDSSGLNESAHRRLRDKYLGLMIRKRELEALLNSVT